MIKLTRNQFDQDEAFLIILIQSEVMTSQVGSLCTRGRYNNDNRPTHSSQEQARVERSVERCFPSRQNDNETLHEHNKFKLLRNQHVQYLKRGLLGGISGSYSSLDCSRPWMVYWISNSLAILGEQKYLRDNDYKIVDFLKRCRALDGGYSGSPQQEGHLAATYAAVNALVSIGGNIAFESIDRLAVRRFFCAMQQPDGSFTLHNNGEVDIRGAYCALSVAKLLNIPIFSDTDNELSKDGLFAKTADWILTCQTYEGGFGAAPGHEAHGGYTFCGVASLVLLGQLQRCNLEALLRWTSNKQQRLEGGFCGRTNKLVDGCYSFWNGAIIPIIQSWIAQKGKTQFSNWIFNQEALQEYVLACCQNSEGGGLLDKPGKHADFYHTCYALAGLSIAQYSMNSQLVVGVPENLVEPIHPLFNVTLDALKEANVYFFEQ